MFSIFFSYSVFATEYEEIGLPVTEVYDLFTHKGANQNWWLAQANNGIIYNGTGTGLNEWDGEHWSVYKTPQKSRIRSISIWKDENIYIGTTNDIGYFYPNNTGSLTYQSLLDNWTFEEKQFGEVWSVASNKNGVAFISSKYFLFWDGKSVQKFEAHAGSHRIFSIGDQFYFKLKEDTHLYTIKFTPELTIEKTGIELEQQIVIRKIIKNKENNLTIITSKSGIFEIANNQLSHKMSFDGFRENPSIYNAIQARDGYYYITSLFSGLYIVDEKFKLVKHYTKEHGLATNSLLSVIEDFQGNIWFSGVPHIIKMIPPHSYSIYKTDHNTRGTEWVTFVDDKITILGDGVVQFQKSEDTYGPAFFKNIAKTIDDTWGAIEFENHIFYGSSGGLYIMPIGGNKDLDSDENIIKTSFVKFMAVDKINNTLYVTSDEGLFRIKYSDNQWQTKKIPGTEDELHHIAIDKSIVWTGTSTQELYKIENAHDDALETIVTKFIDKDGLGPNNVIPFNTSLGLVIGTNNGLMNYQENREPQLQFFKNLPKVFKTKDLDVFRLYEDSQKGIWYRIGNRTGYLYKDSQNKWQTNEDLFRYFPDSGYKGFYKTSENTLWFSLANGEIFRTNIKRTKTLPKTANINIRKIINLDTKEEIFGGLGKASLPTLTQENNSIRINFALTDYSIANPIGTNEVNYKHRLLGSSNEEFSEWDNENHKDFTLLRGNDYKFEVVAKDAWGRESKNSISFSVLPPWYFSKLAWSAYALILMLLLFVSSWFTQKWRTKNLKLRNLELEQTIQERTADVQEKAKDLKQQQEIKDRFFSNVSHEFRTPLTLTIAPLQAFLDDHKELDETFLHPINTALRNSKKMLSLVSQVLDINRLESGRFPLHIAQYNVSELINNAVNRFTILAKQQQQLLVVKNTEEICFLYFDQDQIDKCFSNLIANAIKYSGNNSIIEVTLIKKDNVCGIKVSDNGKGITPEFESRVFERYTQDKTSNHLSEPGTGIGLAFVKEFVELHQGKIELINVPNQECTFIIWLKTGHEHFKASQLVEPISIISNSDPDETSLFESHKQKSINNTKSEDKTTILVVDDNQELREFIVSRLSDYYKIIQASNGQEGLAMANSCLPDLIISDVMMPIMDGLELTKQLKSNNVTKSIPIILLTAQSSKRNTVAGLQTGADDYLTKPFDTSELILRVIRLINGIKLIRETIKSELSQNITKVEKRSDFVIKLQEEILNQISNPKLSVDSLANTLAMSRSSLNRKCKSELDTTTNQIITDTRMQHALNLIKLNKHSITEIAYGTGYESLAYFSRTFKKRFGQTPSQIRNN